MLLKGGVVGAKEIQIVFRGSEVLPLEFLIELEGVLLDTEMDVDDMV